MPRKLTAFDLEREDIWLSMIEDGVSTAEIAQMAGLTQRAVQIKVAKARARREENVNDHGEPEADEAPILHLVEGPGNRDSGWYDLRSDLTSHDNIGGSVLVGNHNGTRLRRQRLGSGRQSSEARNDKYKPDPSLKGGVG